MRSPGPAAALGPAVAVLVMTLATGCTSAPDDAPTTPTTSADAEPPQGGFDCAAVAAAQQSLSDAAAGELERLGIDRSAPEAFDVTLLVTSKGGSDFWGAVSVAATPSLQPDLRADVTAVAAYWASIEEELAAIELGDGTPASLQSASAALAEVSASAPNDTARQAQQRVQEELSATCGNEPSATTSVPSSATR